MCLDRLDTFPTKGYGWKTLYEKPDGRLEGTCTDYAFPVNRWLDANEGKSVPTLHTNNDYHTTYTAGFHAWTSRADARKYAWGVVRKVKLKDVIVTGWQDGLRVIVAKKLLVVPATKRKAK